MDTSTTMDPLNDTPTLPELSFDDLLDVSPIKKSDSSIDDPLEFDSERKVRQDDTLNTPGPKNRTAAVTTTATVTMATTTNSLQLIPKVNITKTSSIISSSISTTKSTTTPTNNVVNKLATTPPMLINSKNVLPKSSSTFANQLIKISPKTTATAANIAGKTAIKTSNGQIIYIQKTTSGSMPAVRLQSATSTTSPTTAATISTTSAPAGAATAAKSNKTVAIQVLRAADGSLKPLKSTTATVTTATKTTLTLSPTMATQLTGKKIISTTGGQMIIKAPMKNVTASKVVASVDASKKIQKESVVVSPTITSAAAGKVVVQAKVSTTASSTAIATTTTATTTAITTTPITPTTAAAAGKIVVQSANGKQIVVSNQHLIKLSPKTTTTAAGGQLQKIKISGKPGVQYVRVLPSSKMNTTSTSTLTTSAASSTATTSTSTIKILNSMPHKFTMVRPTTSTKFMLTQSPKKEVSIGDGNTSGNTSLGVPVTFSPVTTKVQKTIVTLPALRPINDDKCSPSSSSSTSTTAAGEQPTTTFGLMRKHKISEINSEIQRITSSGSNGESGPPEAKKTASGSRIVVMSRSMLRNTNMPPLQPRPGLPRVVVHSAAANSSNISTNSTVQQSPKKLYSVLKSNNPAQTQAKMKSLIICGQAKALMAQQQQHKFMPIKIKQEPPEVRDIKPTLEDNGGVVRRKHCNCSKSQCLKLYCDCFANGEFCQDCTCKDCFNNLQYEDERQRAIKNCLERNPSAFKPKITTAKNQSDMRLHNKGCNCKRSGCLKNYCECYEAKIPCSSNCKCVGCRNVEDRPDLDMDPIDPKILATIANATVKRTYEKSNKNNEKMLRDTAKALTSGNEQMLIAGCGSSGGSGSNSGAASTIGTAAAGAVGGDKPQCNFITQEVIDATIQCMISQADECQKNGLPAYQTEKMIMEELGRCLVEIIDFSIRNTDTSYTQD